MKNRNVLHLSDVPSPGDGVAKIIRSRIPQILLRIIFILPADEEIAVSGICILAL